VAIASMTLRARTTALRTPNRISQKGSAREDAKPGSCKQLNLVREGPNVLTEPLRPGLQQRGRAAGARQPTTATATWPASSASRMRPRATGSPPSESAVRALRRAAFWLARRGIIVRPVPRRRGRRHRIGAA
jgi:hypothetical protein